MRNKKIPYFVDLLMDYILMYKSLMGVSHIENIMRASAIVIISI